MINLLWADITQCGSSGNQYKNAPIAGKMMTALIDYCEAGNDHDTAPLTWTLPYIGKDIDVGFYSRKRSINENLVSLFWDKHRLC